MKIFRKLTGDMIVAITRALSRVTTWLFIIIVSIGSYVVVPYVAQLVPFLLQSNDLSAEINLLQEQPNKSLSPLSGKDRWIQIDINSKVWFTILLPTLIVIFVSGMPEWLAALSCLFGLIFCWFASLESKLFFISKVIDASETSLISSYFTYIVLGLTTLLTAMFVISATQRSARILGLIISFTVAFSVGLMLRFLISSPILNDTITFFCIVSISCVLIYVPRLGNRTGEEGKTKSQLAELEMKPGSQYPYKAFISYRRENGAEIARLIHQELRSRGVYTFLDVEDLASGHFDERLLREIEAVKNFILILTPGCLLECNNTGDWLRREIEHAIKMSRNIIPVLKDGFVFPPSSELPLTMSDLDKFNGVRYDHVMFNATVDKLISFLKVF